MSTSKYRSRLEADYRRRFGYISKRHRAEIEHDVLEYAIARQQMKREKIEGDDFNPYTDDPNCKSCGKKQK
jgi:uncharacterized protein with PIN domain